MSEKRRHPTIADIAAHAGVAPMTVSRVINGTGYASAESRAKVERAVAELDYSPNSLARSLKGQRTNVVGILLPDIANPYTAELAKSAQEALRSRGYSAFFSSCQQSSEDEASALRAFFDHRVDGIIVATRESAQGNEMLQRFLKRHYPIVVIGRSFHHPEVDRVVADGRGGGCAAVRHLIGAGHRRIAFIGLSHLGGITLNRFQGYLDALREAGIESNPDWIVGPALSDHAAYATQMDGYTAMQKLVRLPARPTAVFARNDTTAIGALFAARDAGLQVPRDISIVGFDNVAPAACVFPALTTVDQFVVAQGKEAVRLLIDRIENEGPRPGQEISFGCRLVVRESTAAARE